jgi:hypothetical protein
MQELVKCLYNAETLASCVVIDGVCVSWDGADMAGLLIVALEPTQCSGMGRRTKACDTRLVYIIV